MLELSAISRSRVSRRQRRHALKSSPAPAVARRGDRPCEKRQARASCQSWDPDRRSGGTPGERRKRPGGSEVGDKCYGGDHGCRQARHACREPAAGLGLEHRELGDECERHRERDAGHPDRQSRRRRAEAREHRATACFGR